jgi:hypothetical protein
MLRGSNTLVACRRDRHPKPDDDVFDAVNRHWPVPAFQLAMLIVTGVRSQIRHAITVTAPSAER